MTNEFERFKGLIQGLDRRIAEERRLAGEAESQQRSAEKKAEAERRLLAGNISGEVVSRSRVVELFNRIRRDYLNGNGSVDVQGPIYTPFHFSQSYRSEGDRQGGDHSHPEPTRLEQSITLNTGLKTRFFLLFRSETSVLGQDHVGEDQTRIVLISCSGLKKNEELPWLFDPFGGGRAGYYSQFVFTMIKDGTFEAAEQLRPQRGVKGRLSDFIEGTSCKEVYEAILRSKSGQDF